MGESMLVRLAAALLLLSGVLVSSGAKAQGTLVLLKRVEVDLGTGLQIVDLSDTKGVFRALRIKAVSGRITFSSIVVDYDDQARHEERRRIFLLPVERTREINPTGEPHTLTRVTLAYVRQPAAKATIEIYGRQTIADALVERGPPMVATRGGGKKKKARRRAASPAPTGESARRETMDEMPRPAPPPPPPAPTSRSIASTQLACVLANACTPVQVFFGTNRTRQDLPQRIAFSWQDSGELTLGSAVVTVPRKVQRESGAILRPTWWDQYVMRVPPEGDPTRHFVIVANLFEVYSDETAFLAAVARHREQAGEYKDHAFVYVHGYRVDFDYGLYRTAQMAYDLGTVRPEDGMVVPFGTAFLYSWPSAGQLKDYAYDQEAARLSVAHLRKFLELVIQKTGVKHVHLVAHSMGNVPLLNAMSSLSGDEVSGARVSQVILAAPDMGTREFKTLAAGIQSQAQGFTLYASSSDLAMEASRKVHKNEPRAGDVVGGKPTIIKGIDTIDISAITTCYFCFGHDEYVEQSTLLNDIAALLQRGIRPPDTRTHAFHPETEGELPYWRYER